MPAYVSPGVYVIEKDWSDYSPSLNSSKVGVLGFASQGPVGIATLITDQDQLVSTFGRPDEAEGGFGLIGAYHILERTNTVYYTRTATVSASVADVAVPVGTCPWVAASGLDPDYDYLFAVNVWDGGGALVTGDTLWYTQTAASADSTYSSTPDALRATIEAATTPGSPFSVSVESSGTIDFIGTFAGSGAKLQVVCWGSSDSVRFPVIPAGTTIAGVMAYSGVNTQLSSSTGSTALSAVASNDGAVVVAAGGDQTSSGLILVPNAASGGAYVTKTLYPGAGYNYSSTVSTYGRKTLGLQDGVTSQAGADNQFSLLKGGGAVEAYTVNLTQNTSGTSLNPEEVINNTADETNKTSDFILGEFAVDVSSRDDVIWTPPTIWGGYLVNANAGAVSLQTLKGYGSAAVTVASNLTKYWKLVNGTYNFTGGINGDLGDGSKSFTDADVKAAIIGNGATGNGIYSFLKEDISVDIAAIPGCTEQNIINNLVSIAENSQEFLAVTNPPLGMSTPQKAISWSNGQAVGRTAALNSSYAAVYWPWVKMFNTFTNVDEYISPDIFAIRQMCFTDGNFDAWFAPAGLVRGRLTKPVDVEYVLNQGDRDAMYGAGNCVNPVTKFTTDGIVLWGQRTTQRAATSLDRINVRRLMIVIRKMLLASTRQFVFEPNDAATWQRILNAVSPMLADIQSRRGITEFKVICDGTTNTPLRIDRSELWCKVIIQPTKAAEVIVFELNLTSATLGTNIPGA